jgi:hypothetical protein
VFSWEGTGVAARVVKTLTERMSSEQIEGAALDLREQASLAPDAGERSALTEAADRLLELAGAQRAR